MNEIITNPYYHGQVCYLSGTRLKENPWPERAQQHLQWMLGWIQAAFKS